jgi:FkbM family methyltransferase
MPPGLLHFSGFPARDCSLFYAPVETFPRVVIRHAMTPSQPRAQFLRRDFLVGALGGLTAGAGAWYAAPDRWHEARLPLATLSYAQNGEDLVVNSLLHAMEIDTPTYVDIGAYDPVLSSNTYFFYRKGGHGVLVEPNVDLTPKLQGERPRDVVLTAGVGIDDTTELDFYVLNMPQLNTFDRSRAEQVVAGSGGKVKLLRTVKMPIVNINRVVADHLGAAPDYLSIDVEGLDLAILKTLDFSRFRPAVICTEHPNDPAERSELLGLLDRNGYAVGGQTYPNTIFVDRKRIA